MTINLSVVVTSINSPTQALVEIAKISNTNKNIDFVLIGDSKSPIDFALDGCNFYSIEQQKTLELKYARACPLKHYARKNIGYLIAISKQSSRIVETDDDNIPQESFWSDRQSIVRSAINTNGGWVNVYNYFSDRQIWPRGLPLDKIHTPVIEKEKLPITECYCPIQQGLANINPDVDAVYRLILPLPVEFNHDQNIALGEGSWCPFNSQNTTWFPDAYPLMYLPFYCSFRMTDIWRSFIAQRIAWLNGWCILFHEPTVYQERNEHNLLKDFEDEIPGYLNNNKICDELSKLSLKSGVANIPENLKICYESLIKMNLIGLEELSLLDCWIEDIKNIGIAK